MKTIGRNLLLLVASLPLATMMSSISSAVVTGANRGLGLEMVKQLCEANDTFQKIYATCRKTSEGLTDLARQNDKISVLEGIEVSSPEAPAKLQSIFRSKDADPIGIDLLVHNAGAYGPPRDFPSSEALYSSQNLDTIDMETMIFAFQLNTLAPLFITKALLPNLKAARSDVPKVIIISSLMGSISDTGGGHYAYRTAKAAVNMVGKNMALDLKDDKVAVGLIHPGFVYTGFGGEGAERRPGQRDVDVSVKGVLEAIDQVTLDTTGCFLHGNYGQGVKPLNW